jgi:alanyl-tRNA synthetase
MKDASKMLNGRGGGRPDVAFGGSESAADLSAVKSYLEGLLK